MRHSSPTCVSQIKSTKALATPLSTSREAESNKPRMGRGFPYELIEPKMVMFTAFYHQKPFGFHWIEAVSVNVGVGLPQLMYVVENYRKQYPKTARNAYPFTKNWDATWFDLQTCGFSPTNIGIVSKICPIRSSDFIRDPIHQAAEQGL